MKKASRKSAPQRKKHSQEQIFVLRPFPFHLPMIWYFWSFNLTNTGSASGSGPFAEIIFGWGKPLLDPFTPLSSPAPPPWLLNLNNVVGISAGYNGPLGSREITPFEFNGTELLVYPNYPNLTSDNSFPATVDFVASTNMGPSSVTVNNDPVSISDLTINIQIHTPSNMLPVQQMSLQTVEGENDAQIGWSVAGSVISGIKGSWSFKNYWAEWYEASAAPPTIATPPLQTPGCGEFSR